MAITSKTYRFHKRSKLTKFLNVAGSQHVLETTSNTKWLPTHRVPSQHPRSPLQPGIIEKNLEFRQRDVSGKQYFLTLFSILFNSQEGWLRPAGHITTVENTVIVLATSQARYPTHVKASTSLTR